MIGNGKTFNISNIDVNHFISSQYPYKLLFLKNILHIPSLTKNLLSVSQFTKGNNDFFEFYPTFCYVNDQVEDSFKEIYIMVFMCFILLCHHLF